MAEKAQATPPDDEYTVSKRDRVRLHLIWPLTEWGLQRPAKTKVADFQAMLDRLCDAFGHMRVENLQALRDLITRHATGKGENEWPAEVTVRKWAMAIEPKPLDTNSYVKSIMRSEMGKAALVGGYHVELFMLATKMGPPPGRYRIDQLMQEAAANQRERTLVLERVRRGAASKDQSSWLEWYSAREAECQYIMKPAEGAA